MKKGESDIIFQDVTIHHFRTLVLLLAIVLALFPSHKCMCLPYYYHESYKIKKYQAGVASNGIT